MSLVKKMYGKSVLAEEVNKLLSDSVYKYIQDNKVNILGEPLPNEDKQKAIDFDTMEEFEFLFDIALAPEFKAEITADDKVDYYTIKVNSPVPAFSPEYCISKIDSALFLFLIKFSFHKEA